MKKAILFLLIGLSLVASVSAYVGTDGLVSQYKLDESSGDFIDSIGGYNLSNGGVDYQATGIDGYAGDWELGDVDQANVSDNAAQSFSTAWTINLWIKPESLPGWQALATKWKDGGGMYAYGLFIQDTTNLFHVAISSDGSAQSSVQTTQAMVLGSWQMVTGRYNGSQLTVFYNGTYSNQLNFATGTYDSNRPFMLGAHSDGASASYDGLMDEVTLWNRALTPDEIMDLYVNITPTLVVPESEYFSITAADGLSARALSIFNATIAGIGTFNTTNGTINTNILSNSSLLYNITFKAAGYYDVDYTNINVSNDMQGNLSGIPPTPPTITTPAAGNVSTLLQINYSAASTTKTGGSIGFYNITLLNSDLSVNKSINGNNSLNLGYLYDTVTGSVGIGSYYVQVAAYDIDGLSAAGNSSLIYVLYDARVNISAVANATGSLISNLSVSVYDTTTGITTTANTTGTSVQADVVNGHIVNVSLDASGYEVKTALVTAGAGITNYQFNLYTTNSISFTFYDETTNTQFTNATNVEIELISDIYSANYTVLGNNTLYLDLLSPTTYTIRYSATGYDERIYYLTLTNRSHTDLTLYLLNSSTTTAVTATVYDEVGQVVEGAIIKVLKYDLPTNTYILREMQSTNFEGDAVLNLLLGSEYYRFIIEYPSGTAKLTTDPTYVYSTTISFQISISTTGGENFYNSREVSYTLTASNNTRGFFFTFSDGDGLVSQGCLKVYQYQTSGITLVNSSCVSGSAGSATLYVANITGKTYVGRAYVYYGSDEELLDSVTLSAPATQEYGNLGLILTALVSIFLVFMARDNLAMAPILFVLPIVLAAAVSFINIPIYYVVPLIPLALILSFLITRR